MKETKNMNSARTVIIAGGGTGGHIYPGIAIAYAIRKKYPDLVIHFVGAVGGLEEKIVPREGFPLHLIEVGKLHHSVGVATRIKTLMKMPLALLKAYKILRHLNPIAVLGVGGFASGPILFVASLMRYRTLIWEPNAYPGLANRLLSSFVDECLVVFKEAGQHLKSKHITQSGLPVRSAMIPHPRELNAQAQQSQAPLRILVFGGSQGARFINNLIPKSLKTANGWLSGIEVVHQTGAADFARIKAEYAGAPAQFEVLEYLHDMDRRYAWADLVICRSGASTVAEVSACQKAAVFIPLPTAADDHQRKNAEVLSRAGAALVFLQNDLSPEKLRDTVIGFRDDRSLISKLEASIKEFQFPNAAEKIVSHLVNQADQCD
jgi:UDP-N-acetylglucosamine--N-acetylmuramyl-(pentapeptide) pyrophosphoryl-undecaprenol N-acetylglucosamine transferase